MPQIITPTIAASRVTGVAPLAVTFEAIQTTAPALTSNPFHEIKHSWKFSDKKNESWSYGTNPGFNSKNEASGPVVAHVFETPGTYIVTDTVGFIDGSGVLHAGSASVTVTVEDPDVVFASNTVYMSATGVPVPGQGGVPIGANVQHLTSWSSLRTIAQTYKRILLKRGDTWDINGEAGFFVGEVGTGPHMIGAYGEGPRPVISVSVGGALRFTAGVSDWRVVDLDIMSPDTVFQEFGRGVTSFGAIDILLLRTDVKRTGRILVEGADGAGLYIVDSVIGPASAQGTASISLYTAGTDRVCVLGSRFTGGRDHGIRLSGTATSFLSNVRVDNTRAGSHALTIRGKNNNTGTWGGLWTENVVVSDTVLDGVVGGIATLALKPVNPQIHDRLRQIIVERNRISSEATEPIFAHVCEGLTIRNNILTTRYSAIITTGAQSDVGTPPPTSGWIYNNTGWKIDATLDTNFSAIWLADGLSGYHIRNNLVYDPNSTRSVSNGGALGGGDFLQPNSLVENTHYFLANNSTKSQIQSNRPWLSASPVANADFAPSGSYAVGGGVYVAGQHSDFMDVPVVSARNIGAIRMPSISVRSPRVNRSNGRALVTVTLSSKAPVPVSGVINTANMGASAGVDFVGQNNAVFTIPRGQRRAVVVIPLIGGAGPDLSVNAYVETGYIDDYFEDDVVVDLSVNAYVETGYIDDYFTDEELDLSSNSYVEDDYVDDYVL